MALPKHKISKSKRNSRQSANDRRHISGLSVCPQCGIEKLAHRVCPSCGFYKDRVIAEKKEKRQAS